ncbi:hypothetical protein JZ751_015521 [Albula glossodonta]|uniref:Uncharacterized protein n=1 Tax=Albula glossodonta TaxID=121402 RepID=A0A8T2MYF2_9TELE|nr:hypothetical protein JZ751_015521 [Albula glossodonta]
MGKRSDHTATGSAISLNQAHEAQSHTQVTSHSTCSLEKHLLNCPTYHGCGPRRWGSEYTSVIGQTDLPFPCQREGGSAVLASISHERARQRSAGLYKPCESEAAQCWPL